MKTKIIASVSGTIWTILVAFIIRDRAFWGPIHDVRWIACISGPVVGLGAYYSSRWTFKRSGWFRLLWSAISLYLAAICYGVLLGAMAFILLPPGIGKPANEIGVESFAFVWGITFLPVLWPLFPLAYLNHHFLKSSEETAYPIVTVGNN